MLIFFVRHGLTDWNAQRRFQGTSDIPLNDMGLAQAETAAGRCAQLSIERVYHSALLRAAQTAQAVARACGAPLIAETGFNEVHLGKIQSLTRDEAMAQYPQEFSAYLADMVHVAPPEGENLLQLQKRALAALSKVEEDAKGCERIAVVSHGALLKALLSGIAGIDMRDIGRFDVSNGSISVVESVGGKRRLITLNDMSHFGDPYADMSKTRLLI